LTGHGTQSVDRAFDILDLIGRKAPVSLAEISEASGLTVPTAYRLVKSLTRRGFVSFDSDTKDYSLGPAIVRMAAGMLQGNNLIELARPGLATLNESCGETASMFGIGANELICIAEAESFQRLRFNTGVGRTMPLTQGAPGKAAIAWLDATRMEYIIEHAKLTEAARGKLESDLQTVRASGFAMSFGEVVPETTAVAAPIFDGRKRAIGVISVAGPAGRWTVEKMQRAVPALLAITGSISSHLGG
jgi:DNA-binding IclR family transcriptional regulator